MEVILFHNLPQIAVARTTIILQIKEEKIVNILMPLSLNKDKIIILNPQKIKKSKDKTL